MWGEGATAVAASRRNAHPIITHLAKPIICVVFVGDYHAALFQNGDLAGKCLYLFSVWYLLHRYSKKKAYPKRAVLWEAGQACWAQQIQKIYIHQTFKEKIIQQGTIRPSRLRGK